MKYYIAYGSNLNKEQMARRCPGAVDVGTGKIADYKLVFRRGYLTIEPEEGSSVNVGVWQITDEDEKKLDRYEGFPRFYHKEYFAIPTSFNAGEVMCMAYIMNDGFPIKRSTREYRETVEQGFHDFGFDIVPLLEADLDAYVQRAMESHVFGKL